MDRLFQHSTKKRAMKTKCRSGIKTPHFFVSGFQRRGRSAFCAEHFISGESEPYTLLIGIRASLTAGLDAVVKTKITISPKICRLLNYVPSDLNPSFVPFELSLRRYTCSRSGEVFMTENIRVINMLNGIRTPDCPARTLVIIPAHC